MLYMLDSRNFMFIIVYSPCNFVGRKKYVRVRIFIAEREGEGRE